MAATWLQRIPSRNVRLLAGGRSAADTSAHRRPAVPTGSVPSPCSPPPLQQHHSRPHSGLSAPRLGYPKERMTSENGSSSSWAKVLTIDTMNPTVKKVEYAVRGPIVQRRGSHTINKYSTF